MNNISTQKLSQDFFLCWETNELTYFLHFATGLIHPLSFHIKRKDTKKDFNKEEIKRKISNTDSLVRKKKKKKKELFY